jgi:hypothetical protein
MQPRTELPLSATSQATHTYFYDDGWARLGYLARTCHKGLTTALTQGPVSRFCNKALKADILALLQSNTNEAIASVCDRIIGECCGGMQSY